MLIWNVVENDRSLFDSEFYTLILPVFVGIPMAVAVIAHLVARNRQHRD
jgi:hypothetical protein